MCPGRPQDPLAGFKGSVGGPEDREGAEGEGNGKENGKMERKGEGTLPPTLIA